MDCIIVLGWPNCNKTDIISKYINNSKKRIEFLNIPNEFRSKFITNNEKIYQDLIKQIQSLAKNNPDRIIIEGLPINIVNCESFIKKFSKMFYAISIFDINCNETLIKDIRDKMIHNKNYMFYNLQTKLGMHQLHNLAQEQKYPLLYLSMEFTKDNKSNYVKFKKCINEVNKEIYESQNGDSEQTLDISNPNDVANFFLQLYKNEKDPNFTEFNKCLKEYKNRMKSKTR